MAKIKTSGQSILNICMDNNTQITIADLDTIKNIIDLACSRGAFRAAEASQVGAVYDKLTQFLEAAVALAKQQEADAGQTQGE
jgi:hypothetical protein